MADLTEDLVLEIFSWLSAKNVSQHKCLNKRFYECISKSSFIKKHTLHQNQIHSLKTIVHCSAHNPKIFTIVDPKISQILGHEIRVMASSNGVLLLQICILNDLFYYVFNPTTSGISSVCSSDENYDDWGPGIPGLVVDMERENASSSFKLVEVFHQRSAVHDDSKRKRKTNPTIKDVLKFLVFVPCETGFSMNLKSSTEFVCEEFSGFSNNYNSSKSVYLNGHLHWLGKNGKKILVFNVEKENAKLINGPETEITSNKYKFNIHTWFGVACGSLSFVYNMGERYIILAYDHDKWVIRHIYEDEPGENSYCGIPIFFDGQRLFFQFFVPGENGEIYMVDVTNNKKTKIGNVPRWSDAIQLFFPFFPTLAKVSNEHLQTAAYDDLEPDHVRLVKHEILELKNLLMYSCIEDDQSYGAISYIG